MPLSPITAPSLPLPTAEPQRSTPASGDTAALERTAKDFETAFLAEALSHMGLDRTKGVQGAAPFGSFVNRAYAEQMVERGGLGLSESIVRALATNDDTP